MGQVWREQERCPRSGAQNCIVLKHHEISDSAVTQHYCQLSARYRPNVAHKSASIHSLFVPPKTPKIWKLLCESYNRFVRYRYRRCDMMFLFHRMDFSVFKAYLRLYSIYKYSMTVVGFCIIVLTGRRITSINTVRVGLYSGNTVFVSLCIIRL